MENSARGSLRWLLQRFLRGSSVVGKAWILEQDCLGSIPSFITYLLCNRRQVVQFLCVSVSLSVNQGNSFYFIALL